MTTITTLTFRQAEKAFTFKAPTVQIGGRGQYRSVSINGNEKLVVDHTPTGGPIRAYIEDNDSTIQCYRSTGKVMAKCSPEVYDWGWIAR